MSFELRFVDEFEGQIYIREQFIRYEDVDESSREALFGSVKNTLSKHTFIFKHTFASMITSRLEFRWWIN